jgi:hypothetical protein
MVMKRSEYEQSRRDRWWEHSGDPLKIQVNHDIEAAEAAGVTWDPEEPEWPRKIEPTSWSGSWGVTANVAPDPPRYLSIEEIREVCRRHNLWPRLEGLMQDWEERGIGRICRRIRLRPPGGLRREDGLQRAAGRP